MSIYSIADLEKLSGIKAHTLRIWEKRYNIVEPNRTDTNIRFYNDYQLRKILNVSFLINQGFKISKVAKLDETNLALKVIESSSVSISHESYINDFIISALTFDAELFNKNFDKVISKFGLSETYESVIIPSLNKIGSLWSSGDLYPSQEHFISNLIKQKFYHILEEKKDSNKINKTALLFLPPWENHDFALIYADIILQERGLNVCNIGKAFSKESVYECIEKTQSDYIFSTIIVGHKVSEIQEFCDQINLRKKNANFLLGGNMNLLKLVNTKAHLFNSCKEFENYVKFKIN
jgi:DNA-binding transcriptional MerR regulator